MRPHVRSAGRAFDVDTHYAAPVPAAVNRWPEPIEQRAARAVLRALATDAGDVLVFLPGAAEIRRCCEAVAAGADPSSLRVLPLYGELDAAAQDAALRPAPTAGARSWSPPIWPRPVSPSKASGW